MLEVLPPIITAMGVGGILVAGITWFRLWLNEGNHRMRRKKDRSSSLDAISSPESIVYSPDNWRQQLHDDWIRQFAELDREAAQEICPHTSLSDSNRWRQVKSYSRGNYSVPINICDVCGFDLDAPNEIRKRDRREKEIEEAKRFTQDKIKGYTYAQLIAERESIHERIRTSKQVSAWGVVHSRVTHIENAQIEAINEALKNYQFRARDLSRLSDRELGDRYDQVVTDIDDLQNRIESMGDSSARTKKLERLQSQEKLLGEELDKRANNYRPIDGLSDDEEYWLEDDEELDEIEMEGYWLDNSVQVVNKLRATHSKEFDR